MCRRVDCPRCGRPTFAGCGLHIEQVLGDVPPADRCPGHEQEAQSSKVSDGDDKSTDPGGPRSWLRSFLGKP